MKKILITGKGSYIGTSLIKWLEDKPEDFYIEEISVRGTEWKNFDFSQFDVVFHVAGIAHQKETEENKHLYYEVNRDLAIEVAQKSKNDGVYHFIFLSTMSVYGKKEGIITGETSLNPTNAYGKSKLQAENNILKLVGDNFKVAIIRPPMVYGPNCKGNYPKLAKFAKISPFFFDIHNKRSMVYIENLSEFLKLIIKDQANGIFHPQNDEYVSTADMVKEIANIHQKKMYFTKLFNPFIKKIKWPPVQKVIGNLYYSPELSYYHKSYKISGLVESIHKTEK